jgi:hypothetical protein
MAPAVGKPVIVTGGWTLEEKFAAARQSSHDQYVHLFWGFYYKRPENVTLEGKRDD